MTPVPAELHDLAAYALFDVDAGVRSGRQPLHFFMVSVALYESGPLSDADLRAAVAAQVPDASTLKDTDVQAAVQTGLQKRLFARDANGRLLLTEARRTQLDQARARIKCQRDAFHDHVLAAVTEKGVDVEAGVLREALEARLQALFQDQSATLATAYAQDGALDHGIGRLNLEDRLAAVASELAPGGAQSSKLRRAVLADGLREGLSTLDADGRAFLAALYHRTVALAVLEQDPTVRRLKADLAARRVVYLDTNVVLAAMFSADPRHTLAAQVIAVTKAAGAQLRVSATTLTELNVVLAEADRTMNRFNGARALLRVADNVVLRTFVRTQRDIEHLSWPAFIAQFSPPDAWLRFNAVEIETDESVEEAIKDDRRYEQLRAVVARHKQATDPRVVTTDALNILHVLRVRGGLPADELGNRAWFVTLDASLGRVDRDLVRVPSITPPATRQAQEWCDLFGPCVPPDATAMADYATFLVRSQFGLLAEDPTFVDTSFLAILARSRFDLGAMLEANEDMARQVLVRLAADEEVRQLLGDPEVGDAEWNDQLERALQRTLAELELEATDDAQLAAAHAAQAQAEQLAEDERRQRVIAVRTAAQTERLLADRESELAAARLRAARAERELAEQAKKTFWQRLFGR